MHPPPIQWSAPANSSCSAFPDSNLCFLDSQYCSAVLDSLPVSRPRMCLQEERDGCRVDPLCFPSLHSHSPVLLAPSTLTVFSIFCPVFYQKTGTILFTVADEVWSQLPHHGPSGNDGFYLCFTNLCLYFDLICRGFQVGKFCKNSKF